MLQFCLIIVVFSCVNSLPTNDFLRRNGEDVVVMKQKIETPLFKDMFSIVIESALGKNSEENMFGECFLCSKGVSFMKGWLENGLTHDEIAKLLKSMCKSFHIQNKEVCDGAINIFKDIVLDVVASSKLTSSEICEVITKENCSGHDIQSMEWSVDIPEKKSTVSIARPSEIPVGKPLKVLYLTDIHVDFLYKPFTKVGCDKPLCCRDGNPIFKSTSAGYWASIGKCDIPTWTVEDLFKKLSMEKFDYIIWTGDLLSHNVWNQSKDEAKSTIQFLVNLFLKYFPETPVYPSLGNHEGVPVNNFPQKSIPTEHSVAWLYEELARSWKQWLPSDIGDVLRGGFYTTLVAPKFRMISLNMNFCNNFNWWLLIDSKDPDSELQWLIEVLQKAEENGEKVQIIGHIPPGIVDCLKVWSRNYYKIINRYKDIIAAQFFGHIHYDSFQLFYDTGYESTDEPEVVKPIAVAYISPSVTSYKYLNPGYRVFDVEGFHESSSWSVLDHHTYIMDVKTTRTLNTSTWVHEYSAKDSYGLDSLTPLNWEEVVYRMKSDDVLFEQYHKFYYKSNPQSSCNSSCKKMMLCSLVSGRSYDNTFCKNLYRNNNEEIPFDYSEYIRWYNANKLC